MAAKIFLQRLPVFLALAVPVLLILGRGAGDAIMGIISIWFLVHSWRTKDFSWVKSDWMKLCWMTWGYLTLCGVVADFDVGAGIGRGFQWIRFPIFTAAMVSWILPQIETKRYLGISLITLLGFVAIDTITQYFFGTSLSGFPKPDYPGRLSGPFGDQLIVGIYMARLALPAIGFAFYYALKKHGNALFKTLLIPMAFCAVLALAILLSGERVAFAIFGLAGLAFLWKAKNLRKPLISCAAAGLIALGALIVIMPDLHTRFIDFTRYNVSQGENSSYAVVVHNATTAWKLSPIFGVGPKNFYPACEELRESGGFENAEPWQSTFSCARHPHNIYLEWLTDTGLVGLALFCALVFLWTRQAWRNVKAAQGDAYFLHLGFAAGLIPFLWPLMTAMSFFSNWSAVLFWWVLSLALVKPRG